MQALRKPTNYQTAELLVFPTPMGTPTTQSPQENQPTWNPLRHGNLAQWVAPLITLIVGIISVSMMIHYRDVDNAAKSSDEHINSLIDAKLNPAKDAINSHVDGKIDGLSSKVDGLSDRISRIEGGLDHRVSSLETKADQQSSLARLMDPNRTLALIRAEIEMAEKSGSELPKSSLVDYRNVVHALPPNAHEYWATVAAIINYQSELNQMSGEAPDPLRVSGRCGGVTSDEMSLSIGNVYDGVAFRNCVVDLDTNQYINVTFRDSVIRFHGGPITLNGVVFTNCRFILDLPADLPNAPTPAQTKLLMTLLDSADQNTVTLATHS